MNPPKENPAGIGTADEDTPQISRRNRRKKLPRKNKYGQTKPKKHGLYQ
jgi:hypothetical protein